MSLSPGGALDESPQKPKLRDLLSDLNNVAAGAERASAEQAFFKAVWSLAFRIALRSLRKREDAQDIAQECAMRIFRALNRLTAVENLNAFIVRTTINLVLDKIRSPAIREGNVENIQNVIDAKSAVPAPDYAADIDWSEGNTDLQECIRQLPRELREALLLLRLAQMSHKEAAEKLGVSSSVFHNWPGRAEEQLKQCLEKRKAFGKRTGAPWKVNET